MLHLDLDGICQAEYESKGRLGTVDFVIDINIDGVQLFKNSTRGQAYPILARIHSVGGVIIPIVKAPPFVIGVYEGAGGLLHVVVLQLLFSLPALKSYFIFH